jgi:hypothetical protein
MQHARDHCYTYSPIGMRRNLFAMLTGIGSVISSMDRKAANSPIQGLASQIGVTTSRLLVIHLYEVLLEFGYIDRKTREMPAEILKAVHDALYSEVPYNISLIYVHVLQWVATYGVTEFYERTYGMKFTIEPEIEIEFGADESHAYKWDWSEAHMDELIKKTFNDQKELGLLDNVEEAYEQFYAPYKNKALRKYLETKYPILGVRKGDKVTLEEATA